MENKMKNRDQNEESRPWLRMENKVNNWGNKKTAKENKMGDGVEKNHTIVA